ncbi:MAG: helix-turn-helix domain-containing protein [Paludibacteraceae bacterium]|nr:helix-turn-helix domain-containing protein [Paludibacteraceae bacterium]
MVNGKWYIIFPLLLIAIVGQAQIPDFVIRHLSDVTELGQTTINDIYQDENGCMWFATREGVVRYNGMRLQRIIMQQEDTTSLSSSVVTVVCGDRNGHVFIGDNTIHCYDLHTHTIQPIWQHTIHTFVCQNNLLYIASAPYIIAYSIADAHADTIARIGTDDTDIINHLDICQDRLYISTSKGKVQRLDLSTQNLDTLHTFRSCVSFAREDADGRLWVGTWEEGLHTLDHGKWQPFACPASFIRDIAFTRDALWIGTSQGLYRAQGGRTQCIEGTDTHHSLTNKSAWRIYPDREGTLWIGTYFGGIDYLNPDKNVYTYIPLPSMRGYTPIINSIIPIDAQQYYLCSEGDGLLLYNTRNRSIQQYVTPKTTNIKCSWYDRAHNKIYLGLHLHGLCSFDTQTHRFEHYQLTYAPFYLNQVVRSIIPYDGYLLCGSYNGVYRFSLATKHFVPLDTTLNRLLPHVCDMTLDANGCLWIVGEGVARYEIATGKMEIYQTPIARVSERVCAIADKIYIGTSGYGVYCSSIYHWNPQPVQEIKSRFIHNMLALQEDKMMVVGTDGMELYHTHDGYVHRHTSVNGLPLKSLYNGAAERLTDSMVMLVGMDGITFFNPEELHRAASAPQIVFDNIQINDAPTPADTIIELAAHDMLKMDICTDHYYDRPILRFTLSSWNGRWMELTPTSSTIRLWDLPIGKHALQVEARAAADNRLLASRQIVIRQRTPFYLSLPAQLLYLLVLTILVTVGIKRMKKHYMQKAEYNLQQQLLRNEDMIGAIYACINENLADDLLNVDMLVTKLSIGRTRLFSIVKTSTGLTPNELILRARMRKAAELLQDPASTRSVADVCYEVGFNSPKYFAKCFKKVYNQTPTEYRQQATNNKY